MEKQILRGNIGTPFMPLMHTLNVRTRTSKCWTKTKNRNHTFSNKKTRRRELKSSKSHVDKKNKFFFSRKRKYVYIIYRRYCFFLDGVVSDRADPGFKPSRYTPRRRRRGRRRSSAPRPGRRRCLPFAPVVVVGRRDVPVEVAEQVVELRHGVSDDRQTAAGRQVVTRLGAFHS